MTGFELDRDVKRELSSLRAEAGEQTAKHLVMVGRLIDSDPEAAHAHAVAARRLAPRLGVVREAVGLAAYQAGLFADALSELRAARRISGGDEHWPVLADCERALGRPERALTMAAAPEVERLDRAGRVEMRIVAAGARADLGQLDAAVVTLQSPELNDPDSKPWVARLRYAYAEALSDVGRLEEARLWFARAADADPDGLTPAAERLQEIDGVTFEFGEDEDDEHGEDIALGEPPADATADDSADDSASPADLGSDRGRDSDSEPEVGSDLAADLDFGNPDFDGDADLRVGGDPDTEPDFDLDADLDALADLDAVVSVVDGADLGEAAIGREAATVAANLRRAATPGASAGASDPGLAESADASAEALDPAAPAGSTGGGVAEVVDDADAEQDEEPSPTESTAPSTPPPVRAPVPPVHAPLTLFSDVGATTAEPISPPAGAVPAPWHDGRDGVRGESRG